MSNSNQPVPVDVTNTTVQHKSNVPRADIDLGTVLRSVSAQYATCGLVLPWISGAQAIQLADDYTTDLKVRNIEGGKRPSRTKLLNDADEIQNESLTYAKNYFIEKYDKEHAIGYYAEMGLVKIGNSYRIPNDRESRLETLGMIVTALTSHGFISNPYGATYWTTLATNYDNLLNVARSGDSLVTNKVSSKNTLKAQGKKFLLAMVNLVKAMHPDDYKAKLREWGFQKEKY